jgi:hypothetical protein
MQTVREQLVEALRGMLVNPKYYSAKARRAIERANREPESVDTWNDWKPPMVDCTTPGRITVKRPLPGKP